MLSYVTRASAGLKVRLATLAPPYKLQFVEVLRVAGRKINGLAEFLEVPNLQFGNLQKLAECRLSARDLPQSRELINSPASA